MHHRTVETVCGNVSLTSGTAASLSTCTGAKMTVLPVPHVMWNLEPGGHGTRAIGGSSASMSVCKWLIN